jgi:ADP-ribosylglycohydrolase
MERLLWKERRGASKMAEVLGQPRAGTVEDAINDGRGCGALPVVSSVGLVTVLDRSARRELAEKLAAITHGHRDAQLAAGAMAELVDLLRWNSSLDEAAQSVEQRLYDTPGADAVRDALGAARRLAAATPESIAQLGGGWAAPDALAIAVFCALSVGSVEERLLAAVNHSGDSDACGALCGQLLGTAHGAHAIPEHWRRRIELRRTVDAMADDLVAWFEHPDRRPSDELWAWVRYPGW